MKELSFISGRNVRQLTGFNPDEVKSLEKIGISFANGVMDSMSSVMDAAGTPIVTTPSAGIPLQFGQSFLPGFVAVVTAPRKIDELVGIQTIGGWEDEEIVQGAMESTGAAVPYRDYTNTNYSSFNVNYERRTIVRFEGGMRVGALDEARSSKMGVNSATAKREGAVLALDIQRNRIGFNGFNNGNNRTYGFLNDPSLSAYVTVANKAGGGSTWAVATFIEVTKDIRQAAAALELQSQGLIDTSADAITLAIPSSFGTYLSLSSDFGVSVQDWISKTYPKMRIVRAPELIGANGGANVFYMYAEQTKDTSTDGGQVWAQAVPAKFRVLGSQKLSKGYEEAYTNATAGVLLKRPWAVVRRTGI